MSSKSLFPFSVAVLLASSVLFFGHPVQGTVLKRLNLEKLWESAGTVFYGVCTKLDSNDSDTIIYTFSILRAFKGHSSSSVTVRMHKRASSLARVPTFRPGQEVVLFLYPESAYGFTSPVGFGQGTFHVIPGHNGRRMVVNELNNKGLFSGMDVQRRAVATTSGHTVSSTSLPAEGPLDYEAFVELLGILASDHTENQKSKAPLD